MAKAHSKNIGYSSYKMRRVIDQIRSKSVFEAKLQLNLLGTPLAKEILKIPEWIPMGAGLVKVLSAKMEDGKPMS